MILHSPTTGKRLAADTPHSLADGEGRWPVVEGLPYLRTGRDALVADVLDRLDAGDETGALVELLRDADDWWDEPPPDRADLHALLRARATVSLRQAMTALGFGRVGDYFAHRWTDPTFLAGLGLIEAHWSAPKAAFELACGIGHYLGLLQQQGVAVTGVDVVFAKLWLARHFVLGPSARLVCCDAAAPWPVTGERFDLVLCQDAFYFLEPKPEVLARLRAAVAPNGVLLVGHVHNRGAANPSAGAGLSPDDAKTLFPQATSYDDAELTRAVAEGRPPRARPLAELAAVEAFAFAEQLSQCSEDNLMKGMAGELLRPACGEKVAEGRMRGAHEHPSSPLRGPSPRRGEGHTAAGRVSFASPQASLRRNPLYVRGAEGWTVAWPSERYRAEYAALATYPLHDASEKPTPETIRRRVFVALPERW